MFTAVITNGKRYCFESGEYFDCLTVAIDTEVLNSRGTADSRDEAIREVIEEADLSGLSLSASDFEWQDDGSCIIEIGQRAVEPQDDAEDDGDEDEDEQIEDELQKSVALVSQDLPSHAQIAGEFGWLAAIEYEVHRS